MTDTIHTQSTPRHHPAGRRRTGRLAAAIGLLLLATALAGCNLKNATAGAGCSKVGDYAQDGAHILKCSSQHSWVRGITTASADAALKAWLNSHGPQDVSSPRATSMATPPVTITPNLQSPSIPVPSYLTQFCVAAPPNILNTGPIPIAPRTAAWKFISRTTGPSLIYSVASDCTMSLIARLTPGSDVILVPPTNTVIAWEASGTTCFIQPNSDTLASSTLYDTTNSTGNVFSF